MEKNYYLLRTDYRSGPRKFFRITNLLTLFCLVAVFCVFGNNTYSQATSNDNAANQLILSHIDNQTDATAIPQQLRISGTVTNETGDPLVGATVQVEGTTTGAITDADGRYSVEVPDQNAVLVFSFVGYVTQSIPVAGQTTINVSMEPTLEALAEVVVTGYGTQRRTSVTGSISVVKGDEVAKVPVANISNSIAGKLAGVSMRPNGAQPGDDNPDIHIRGIGTSGENAPLIVVDGVIRDNINQVDPTIIESVSILKDAAAVAPYGMGGANGVILITTKKGETSAPTLTLNTYYGLQTPTYYPDLLDAQDYMTARNESYLNENPGGTDLPFALDLIEDYPELNAKDMDLYPSSNTDDLIDFWIPIQNHNLQLRGGSERMKYFSSVGYYRQDGVFEDVNYSRFNYSLNLDSKVTNTTSVTVGIIGSIERTNDLDVASSAAQLFRSGYKFLPTEAIYYSNGLWGQFAGNSPVAVLNSGGYDYTDGNTLLTSISIEQQIPFIKGLSVKGSFSYDTRITYRKGWHRPFVFYAIDTNVTPYEWTEQISTQEGSVPTYTYLTQTHTKRQYFTYQGYLNYQRTFGRSEITGLVVAEARNNTYESLDASRNNFAITVDELNMGSSDKNDFDNGGSSSVGAQIGYVYRLGYVFDNRYMVEASGRYDGHYYFAPGKRWGYFPAFSLGWRISQENFMRQFTFIDNLKLRASWGKSGNLAGSAYQYLSGYNLSGNRYAWGAGQMVQGAYVTTENNPNITWEVSEKTDIGFESSFWNSLLMVEFDYFFEHRTGMLLEPEITVPIEYGLNLAEENAGIMDNRGIELTIGSRYQLQNGLILSFDGNFSIAKNKMVEMFETAATYDNPNRRRTGRPFETAFGYHALGLFQESDDTNGDGIISIDEYPVTQFGVLHPGDIKYEDLSGPDGVPDGKIDSNDECEVGYPLYPLMSFGFTPSAQWKGFDLSLFFQGSAMCSFNINTFQTVPFYNNNSNCDYEYWNDHWTADNPNGLFPRATSNPYANNHSVQTDFWFRNTSYLRLKTLTFGYTLPPNVTQFLTVKNVRLYFSGQNLITFSNLKFMDPEMGYSQRETSYPQMKSFSLGANITF